MKAEKEYKIESFEDLCNLITVENKDRLLPDVVAAFSGYAEAMDQIRKEHPSLKKENNWDLCQFGFKWYDDGKHEYRGSIIETDNAIIEIKPKKV